MATTVTPHPTDPARIRRCGTDEMHRRLYRLDPEYRWRSAQVQRDIRDWLARYRDAGLRSGLIRIPVVVHVVYNTPQQNISDAQIQTQIAVLNADFRRLNADAVNTPAAFAGVAADARIEFALAVRAPGCVPTNGITRTATSVTGWNGDSDRMKATATGGIDPWDVTRYLNVWIVNIVDGILGRGTFPAMPASIQGIICDYRAFGTIGTLTPHAALGRTMTHEIGHYLDLHHIWGDEESVCTDSDLVNDTPNQLGHTKFGPCPAFPQISCGNGPNGNMFQNYMDYSGDECFNLFTAGQVARMDGALHTQRAALLASDGLVPVGSVGPDLWMQDVSDDVGAEPDPSGQPMYISDDIWVRNANDGLMNQDHQNPEYRTPPGPPNYAYVRVRNRGCSGSQSGTVFLYWAKASTGLAWPSPWDGSVTAPVQMGNPIGSQPVTVAAGTDEILVFPWSPPNPAAYAAFGAAQGHFCLLARIETSSTAPFGMTTPETGDLYANVRRNNNIVWKNLTVVDQVPGAGRASGILVANFSTEYESVTLVFTIAEKSRATVFEWGQVLVELPRELLEQAKGGCENAGVHQVGDGTFQILETGAKLGPFKLCPGALHGVQVRFIERHQVPFGVHVLTLDLTQRTPTGVVGGQRFVIKTAPDPRDLVAGGGDPAPAHAPCGCGGR